MKLKILRTGEINCVYSEALNLSVFGNLHVERASRVEFDAATQRWIATLSDGTEIGQFASRANAIAAEVLILESRL